MTLYHLTSESIQIEVLPHFGGAISKCYFGGAQIFAISPYSNLEPTFLGDEADWVRAWNGGWQLAIPNAGSNSMQLPYPQGFHGNASQDKWLVEHSSHQSILLRWRKEELDISRVIRVMSNQILVECSVTNLGLDTREIIATEHLVFGDQFIQDPITLHPDENSEFMPLDQTGSKFSAIWQKWGSTTWETLTNEQPARMGVLKTFKIALISGKIRATIAWDKEMFPFTWLWQEFAKSRAEPWNGLVQALGIEPAMTDNGLGLTEASRTGQALRVAPATTVTWHMSVTLEDVKGGD